MKMFCKSVLWFLGAVGLLFASSANVSAQDVPAAGTDGEANGDFAAAIGGAGGEEAGEIGAGGEKNEKRQEHDRGHEGWPRESLVDPAVAKVWIAGEFLGRRRPSHERDQAGEELCARSLPFERKPRSRQLRRRVQRNSYILPLMQMSDLKQMEWPPKELYAR